jgi:inosine-uridine nucleoside N-ribohydrolase
MFVMGGAVEVDGNVDPLYKAEWNFYIDPKADNILLSSGVPITLGSMDYTNLIPFNEAIYKLMSAKQETAAAQFLVRYEAANPWRTNSGIYLWDQSTAVMMMNESMVKYSSAPICVVEEGEDQGDIVPGDSCPVHEYGVFADNLDIFKEYWQVVNGE